MNQKDSKQHQNFKKGNTRLLLLVSVCIIGLVVYFTISNYLITLNKSKDDVLHRLMAISRMTAQMIDGDLHERLANEYVSKDDITQSDQDSSYLKIHSILAKVKDENQLVTPIYTIVYYPMDSTFHFIATSSETPYFRHSYTNYPPQLLTQYQTGGILDTYKDENGEWLSAFAPVKNKEGDVVALLQCDENFAFFSARAKSTLIQNSLISIAIVIPFVLLIFNYISRSLTQQAADRAVLLTQKEEIEIKNKLIEQQNLDLDNRVKERTEALQLANLELSNFLYHSSHDVQAPIATLKGLQILAKREIKDGAGKEYLTLLGETILRLERIIKTIKLVHETKTCSLEICKINLRDCIQELVTQSVGKSYQIKTIVDVRVDLEVVTDKTLLQASLREIFKNSVQYRSSSEDRLHQVQVRVSETKDYVNISVEDNGEGMSPESRNNIFTLFKRGHEKSTGLGLGLYIARACLDRLNGRILLLDKEGDGAKFLISIPANYKQLKL